MTETTPAAVDRALGGCPVMHRDFSPAQPAGCHWEQADALRESSPLYFNTFAQGYWVFTRYDAVRDMYKNPDLFSSASITPWEPDPIYRFVPTQIDPPDHIQYRRILNPWFSPRAIDAAEPRIRDLCRRLVADVAPAGSCDFVTEFALRFPTEAFLSVVGIDPADAELFVPWVEDFFGGFGGGEGGPRPHANAPAGIPGGRAGGLPGVLGDGPRRAPRRARAARRRPRLAPSACDLRRAPPDGRRAAGHADGAGAGRARHDARRARLHVQASRRAPRAPADADRPARGDSVRGRGGSAVLHDHLRGRAQ